MNRTRTLRRAQVVALGGLLACSTGAPAPDSGRPDDTSDPQTHALLTASAHPGRKLFERPLPGTNGRSCATCHVLAEDTTLKPASVEARLLANPQDPLFHRLDADDPGAEVPTFEHLKKGLVRVVLPLPENMDVIDTEGHVVTPADRTIFVWRGVPSAANTAATGPYQSDGRLATLQDQAQAAITSHSEGPQLPRADLDLIASFERALFTSLRARAVSALVDLGVPIAEIPAPEAHIPLSPQEARGREVYKAACLGCHGGATTDRIVNREALAFFFPALRPDGNVRFDVVPGKGPVPVRVARPGIEFMNGGFGLSTYFGQIGLSPAFNDSVAFPRYRFRFYQDARRQVAVVDLPPAPVTRSGNPLDPRPALDQSGAPIVGPNLVPQLFTTDPGRAVVTGDPADFEAFDMPQLRGIARTAPYFHDNSHGTLREVVDTYSRLVLPFTTPLHLPAVHPPEKPGGRAESLSVRQKEDLLVFLERL